jgi:hypothetical protein
VIKYAAALLSLVAAATAATAAGVDVSRCVDIDEPGARLACYDALAHRPANRTPAASVVKPSATAAEQPPPAAAPAVAAAAPVPATAAPASAAAIPAPHPKNFGLTLAQQHMAFAGPASIDVRIEAINSGPNGRTFIVLDSGETWTINENDGWLSKGDAVTIKRAAMGAFILTTPSNHTYYVRRVQ